MMKSTAHHSLPWSQIGDFTDSRRRLAKRMSAQASKGAFSVFRRDYRQYFAFVGDLQRIGLYRLEDPLQ